MEEKMDSENSYTGESSSSSETSSGSSEGDEEILEPVRILGHSMELPQELCEDYSVFKEFFSMKTWESLESKHKEELMNYLPKFTDDGEEEMESTIKMLFNHEPFHFSSPIGDFYNNLRQGNYRPDIAKMRKFLMKARSKQQRHKIKSYYAKLLPEVLISRERVLAAAKAAPPGPTPRLPPLPPKQSSKNNYKPLYLRAKQRYFEELAAIRSEVGGDESDDENYPEGPPEQFHKKRKQGNPGQITDGNISGTLGGFDQSSPTSLECLKNVLAAHKTRRQYRENHPELNINGISLDDIKQRVALVNGAKKLMFGGQKAGSGIQKLKRGQRKDAGSKQTKGNDTKIKKAKDEPSLDSIENKPLLPNIKIKCEQEESDSESSSFVDSVTSPKHAKKPFDNVEIKQEVVDVKYHNNMSNMSYNDTLMESDIKQEPLEPGMPVQNTSRIIQPIPIKLEDLDGIDMMALPVELADECGEVIQVDSTEHGDEVLLDGDESLAETTHGNFLSLVRALFPARAAHRASKQQLHARCAAVIKSPIAPLNTWYNLSDDWCSELDSALDFLAGERGPHPDDFVPYLQYIPETQMYQWIGAGRDCDAILGRLCERWLRAASPGLPATDPPPPPPRYPTSWVVRPQTTAEISEFRAQERRRFSSAAKPFTYIQHGYRSVVGPCSRSWGGGGGGGGGAGSTLLSADRPRHATLAIIVRDALARLPNGEGTRHDVLTLLKMSQWIAPCSDQALLGAVSTALDKLHSVKRDPVVKYDQRSAVWTYLHRHRSEEDWVKLSSRGRGKAAPPPLLPPPVLPPHVPSSPIPPPDVTPAPPQLAPPPAKMLPPHSRDTQPVDLEVGNMEEIIDASDSDVDVDDISLPSSMPQLSSAQLLMQATQQTKQPTPNKPKGKLVATPPQKPKQVAKPTPANKQGAAPKATLMTQSVKQATLLAQSIKQGNLVAVKTIAKTNLAAQTTKTNLVAQTTASNLAAQITRTNLTAQTTKSNLTAQTTKTNLTAPTTKSNLTAQTTKTNLTAQTTKTNLTAHTTKTNLTAQTTKPNLVAASKQTTNVPRQSPVAPQVSKPIAQQKATKPSPSPKQTVTQTMKSVVTQALVSPSVSTLTQSCAQLSKSLPSLVTTPQKSPLIKQRPLLKTNVSQESLGTANQASPHTNTVIHTPIATALNQNIINKTVPGTRSLLIRPPAVHTTVSAVLTAPIAQSTPAPRRGVVRVLSPATPSSGKSLISPRALMQGTPTTKKRATLPGTASVTTIAQSTAGATTVVSSAPTVVTSSATRTVQLAGGRTVQLAANQTVHLPGGQSVQLTSGHTLQLSSLQLPTHSVRLPSGQTVQLASPQTVQAVRVSTTAVKNPSPRGLQSSPTIKNIQTGQPTVQIPVSTVQLAGQTVQIGGQTVQLAGQSVQLTGHTVKLPSGQSVQVASQSVIPSQSVQLPSGQTVQLSSGNLQTVQLSGANVQLSGQSVQMPSGQSVQLGGQTVQLAGQTVQLAGGQTLQLPSGQTLQLSSGQTLQLAGQTMQLADQTAKSISQVVRCQTPGDKTMATQPIVAKLLTNAQGQMISLESMMGGGRTLQVGGVRPRAGVRVISPATRLTRPLLLTSAKPLHNIILQQSDGSAIRVTSSGGVTTTQTLVLGNIGSQTVTTSTASAPVFKLQQVNPIQQVKFAQGVKIQQNPTSVAVPTSSGVRSVVMDGQQLKLVGGRHVLARILRPAHPQ